MMLLGGCVNPVVRRASADGECGCLLFIKPVTTMNGLALCIDAFSSISIIFSLALTVTWLVDTAFPSRFLMKSSVLSFVLFTATASDVPPGRSEYVTGPPFSGCEYPTEMAEPFSCARLD